MTGKRAKSAERTSFGTPGTTETLGALHSPPVASGELCRLLPSTPFQSSSGECRLTQAEIASVEAGTTHFHTWGVLHYTDAFQEKRTTRFAFSFGGPDFARSMKGIKGASWSWPNRPGHNHTA
jgi:hypothetical protein